MLTVTGIRHAWPEKAGFCLDRTMGHPDYSFVHFFNSVEITLQGETTVLPPHTCILYRPGTPQHFLSVHPLHHDWFHLQATPETDRLLTLLSIPTDTLLYPRRTDFITGIVQETESEFFGHKSWRDELLDGKLRELFYKLARELSGENNPFVDQSVSERLSQLRGDMFLELSHHWTVEEMAARVGFSQSRFYSLYRAVFGNSPMDDLIHARIDAAKNALLFSSASVSAIADSLGYTNLTHFIRQFRSLTGQSPAKFRCQSR